MAGTAERPVGGYTADEMMAVPAARALRDGMTCFVGIGADAGPDPAAQPR